MYEVGGVAGRSYLGRYAAGACKGVSDSSEQGRQVCRWYQRRVCSKGKGKAGTRSPSDEDPNFWGATRRAQATPAAPHQHSFALGARQKLSASPAVLRVCERSSCKRHKAIVLGMQLAAWDCIEAVYAYSIHIFERFVRQEDRAS